MVQLIRGLCFTRPRYSVNAARRLVGQSTNCRFPSASCYDYSLGAHPLSVSSPPYSVLSYWDCACVSVCIWSVAVFFFARLRSTSRFAHFFLYTVVFLPFPRITPLVFCNVDAWRNRRARIIRLLRMRLRYRDARLLPGNCVVIRREIFIVICFLKLIIPLWLLLLFVLRIIIVPLKFSLLAFA